MDGRRGRREHPVTLGLALLTSLCLLTSCGASLTGSQAQVLETLAFDQSRLQSMPAEAEAFAQFGSALATDGDWAAATSLGSQVGDRGVGGLVVYDVSSGEPEIAFEAESPVPGSRYGQAVAISGEVAAVGAPYESGPAGGDRAGAVHVYERSDSGWSTSTTLTSNPPLELAYFGESLALDDETLAVGAPGVGDGSVYLFERSGGEWRQTDELRPEGDVGERRFGSALALDDGRLAVGAWSSDDTEGGLVHLYQRSPGAWTPLAVVESGGAGDRYGFAVDLEGDLLAVGAPGLGGGGPSVHLYRLAGGGPRQEAQLAAPDGASGFGLAVALVAGHVLVSAPTASTGGGPPAAGKVFVFSESERSWRLTAELASPSATAEEEFGAALAAGGDELLVGAPGGGAEPLAGDVYRLQLTGSEIDGGEER